MERKKIVSTCKQSCIILFVMSIFRRLLIPLKIFLPDICSKAFDHSQKSFPKILEDRRRSPRRVAITIFVNRAVTILTGHFHGTLRQPCWCSKTKKRRTCCTCTKPTKIVFCFNKPIWPLCNASETLYKTRHIIQ